MTLNKQSFSGVACCTSEKTKRLKDLERPNCVGVWRPWAAGLSRKYKEWTPSDKFTTHLILLKSASIMSCTLFPGSFSDIMTNTHHVGLTGSCGVMSLLYVYSTDAVLIFSSVLSLGFLGACFIFCNMTSWRRCCYTKPTKINCTTGLNPSCQSLSSPPSRKLWRSRQVV